MLLIKLKTKHLFQSFKIKRKGEVVSKQAGKTSLTLAVSSWLFKIMIIGFFGMIVLFPFFYMISGALMTYDEITDKSQVNIWPKVLQWSNFTKAFQSGYWDATLLTAITTFASIVLKLIMTMLMGYAFSLPKWRGKKFIWAFLISLMMLPEIAIMGGQYAVVTNLRWRYGVMLIASLILPFIASVFSTLMFRNAFEAIPLRTKEASMVDGVSGIKYFFKIAVPMVSPTSWTVGILTAFAAWNSFMWPSLLLSNGRQSVISTWLFTTGMDPNPNITRILIQIRLAAAILAILPMFIAYFIMRARIMRAISRQGSAIKG